MSSIEAAPVIEGAPATPPDPGADLRAGVLAALATYSLWGVLPLYFRLLEGVDPLMVVANRVVFSVGVVLAILLVRRALPEIRAAFANRRVVLAMAASTLLIAVNWLTFVWGVANERVLEVSFGYFINPLLSVAIGVMLLGERFSRLQVAALVLALGAVALQAVGLGAVPWVSIILALSFGFYGYVRKVAAINATVGLFVETLMLTPVALGIILWQVQALQAGAHYADPWMAFLLVLSGPVTAIPLIAFSFAARRLKLSTIGMFQYITPSMHFLLATLVFGEALTPLRLVSFGLIWLALIVFTSQSFRSRRAGAA